jgi:hypothetical protein
MIQQVAPVPQKTTRLGVACHDLAQAHNIQVRLRERIATETKPETGLVSSPLTGMPYMVPILRWIE